ncbi:MAG TPA: hypothetical protein VJ853_13450, partial [Thermoanaerobaculia bacterium]|nr:hypothetical protein [Thermoanaerobaculia bacterium]
DGIVSVRPIWDGADLEEIEADFPSGHFEGLTLRLYDPRSHQWNLSWANANDGMLTKPNYGAFASGRGEFYDHESNNGKTILVRQVYSAITHDAYHFEQSFSADEGRTWSPNFVADLKRIAEEPRKQSVSAANRSRDFDFNFGRWKTHVSRLNDAKKWVDYEGTSDVAPVWDGRASLLHLVVSGPAGRIDGIGLRLYNPETREWNLNWINTNDREVGGPMIGGFANGRGDFLDQEKVGGRAVLVRNNFTQIKPESSHFEQAISDDGGKTWETNWVMTFVRES